MTLKDLRAWLGQKGDALPAASREKRGQLQLEFPSSGKDKPYLALQDGAGGFSNYEIALWTDVIAAAYLTASSADALFTTPAEVATIIATNVNAYLTSATADALFTTPAEVATIIASNVNGYLTSVTGDALFLTQSEGDARYLFSGPFQPDMLARGVVGTVVANGNATTFTSTGVAAPTITNFAISNVDTAAGARIQINTSAVIANSSSLVLAAPGNAIRTDWNPWFDAIVEPSTTLSSLRDWIGFFSAAPTGGNDPTLHGFGFRFDPSIDTNWMCWSNDNSGGGLATSSAVAAVAGTPVRLAANVRSSGTAIDFYVNDVLRATHSTNLPTVTTYLGGGIYCTTTVAGQRAIRINRFSFGY